MPLPDGDRGAEDLNPSIVELEAELASLRNELEEYQRLIEELPEIYETKFSHKLRDVAQDIRRLMEERHVLQQQINRALTAPGALPLLQPPPPPPPATAPPAAPRFPVVWKQGLLGITQGWTSASRWLRRKPRWVLALLAGSVAFALATMLGPRWRPAPSARPAPPATPSSPAAPSAPALVRSDLELRLRASGEAWLEVQTLAGEVLYVNTLQQGEGTTIRLRNGLRIRSGRPDLLEVAVGDQPFQPLGPVYDLNWRTVRPPVPPS